MFMKANWPATGLALAIDNIERSMLAKEYEEARRSAPRRHSRGKRYFVDGHDGRLTGAGPSGRFEEHLAMAIWRYREMRWPRPGGGWFQVLDYQFPLKDAGNARDAVDLLGVTDGGRLIVAELKVAPLNGRGASPADALMQALRYAAVVDANCESIGQEVKAQFEAPPISKEPPVVQILAPKAWWRGWTTQLGNSTRRKVGFWEPSFISLVNDIEDQIGIAVECLALDDFNKADLYEEPKMPTLPKPPSWHTVQLSGSPVICTALPQGYKASAER